MWVSCNFVAFKATEMNNVVHMDGEDCKGPLLNIYRISWKCQAHFHMFLILFLFAFFCRFFLLLTHLWWFSLKRILSFRFSWILLKIWALSWIFSWFLFFKRILDWSFSWVFSWSRGRSLLLNRTLIRSFSWLFSWLDRIHLGAARLDFSQQQVAVWRG